MYATPADHVAFSPIPAATSGGCSAQEGGAPVAAGGGMGLGGATFLLGGRFAPHGEHGLHAALRFGVDGAARIDDDASLVVDRAVFAQRGSREHPRMASVLCGDDAPPLAGFDDLPEFQHGGLAMWMRGRTPGRCCPDNRV